MFNAAPTKHISVDDISSSSVIVCFTDNWDEVGTCVIGTLGTSQTGDKSVSFPEADGGHVMFNSNGTYIQVQVLDVNIASVSYAVKSGFQEAGYMTGLDLTGGTITVRSSHFFQRNPHEYQLDTTNTANIWVVCFNEEVHEQRAVCLAGSVMNTGTWLYYSSTS